MLKWKKSDDFYKNYREILSPVTKKIIFEAGADGNVIIKNEE
jgi:hypothetical protein